MFRSLATPKSPTRLPSGVEAQDTFPVEPLEVCCSAQAFDTDRRAGPLMSRDSAGSNSRAQQQHPFLTLRNHARSAGGRANRRRITAPNNTQRGSSSLA